jgi:large subunit ribosomal protein L18
MSTLREKYTKRKDRIRTAIRKKNKTNRVRLTVHRSNKNIYVQLIDDMKGITVASASTLDQDIKSIIKKASTVEAAREVGKKIATEANKLSISQVVFDKGAYQYHGRIKALADAARETQYLNF